MQLRRQAHDASLNIVSAPNELSMQHQCAHVHDCLLMLVYTTGEYRNYNILMQIISMQVFIDCSLTNQIGSKVTQWKTREHLSIKLYCSFIV